ncbi:Uncharacterised protein [Acinetobacter baumannii]|nr:Uncharacterised protein [Acinetobacter baumannii]
MLLCTLNIGLYFVFMCLGNQWPKVVACICIVAELQFFHFLSQLINHNIGNFIANGNRNRKCHTTFARRAKSCT